LKRTFWLKKRPFGEVAARSCNTLGGRKKRRPRRAGKQPPGTRGEGVKKLRTEKGREAKTEGREDWLKKRKGEPKKVGTGTTRAWEKKKKK